MEYGANVAVIEAQVKAGQTISLTGLDKELQNGGRRRQRRKIGVVNVTVTTGIHAISEARLFFGIAIRQAGIRACILESAVKHPSHKANAAHRNDCPRFRRSFNSPS
jgi:hypothetical protein